LSNSGRYSFSKVWLHKCDPIGRNAVALRLLFKGGWLKIQWRIYTGKVRPAKNCVGKKSGLINLSGDSRNEYFSLICMSGGADMDKTDKRYAAYLDILHEELVPAMGCTEPITIAYASARAREVLGRRPERVLIEASDNIFKNVKSAVVPNTGNLKGIEASAVAGIVAGDAGKVLEVIASVDDNGRKAIANFLATKEVKVCPSKSGLLFDVIVTVFHGESSASVQISHYHTNIVRITKDEKIVYRSQDCDDISPSSHTDRSMMTVKDILEFAESIELSKV
jgi:L-cysteine desulfidase